MLALNRMLRTSKSRCAMLSIFLSLSLCNALLSYPSEPKSRCINSDCADAVLINQTEAGWDDGCKRDPITGVCIATVTDSSSACATCQGADTPASLCFYDAESTETCIAAANIWTFAPCGLKDRRRCAAAGAGAGPSGCCDSGTLLSHTTDVCQGPKCTPQ